MQMRLHTDGVLAIARESQVQFRQSQWCQVQDSENQERGELGKPEIIAEDQTKALSVGGLSYVYSVYLLFILCLPPKKD